MKEEGREEKEALAVGKERTQGVVEGKERRKRGLSRRGRERGKCRRRDKGAFKKSRTTGRRESFRRRKL